MTDQPRPPRTRWLRSVRMQGLLLSMILLTLPVLIFATLDAADEDRRQLVLNAVEETGDAVAAGMTPMLHEMRPTDIAGLRRVLSHFAASGRSIMVLLRHSDEGVPTPFYLMETQPQLTPERTDAERQQLLQLGILPNPSGDCRVHELRGRRSALLDNGTQAVTSVTSVNGTVGCWVIVIATNEQRVLGEVEATPYWIRPEVQWAIAIYLLMATLIVAMFGGVWRDLLRFRRLALVSPDQPGFAQAADTPELASMATAFDSMVDRLRRSARMLRQAAEDNAHAFKAPIGTIRIAIEPVRQNGTDALLPNAIPAIAAALDRLDGLVQSARRLDTAAAELLESNEERVDLSALVRTFVAENVAMMPDITIEAQVTDGIAVLGEEDKLDTILETLVDNAVSFSPAGGRVVVSLLAHEGTAVLTVEDEGPGIPPDRLARVFERYYSNRPAERNSGQHFGIGLWLARQNALAMGGRIAAANRSMGGLCMTVVLPLAV